VDEVIDEPLYRSRVCGIDLAKASLEACIRVPSGTRPGGRAQEIRSFATTRKGVLELSDWLRCNQVPCVVMEATGDYWKGPFYRLEAEGLDCTLADAKQVKHLPGRPKTDKADARWLAVCFERGSVRSCFVPTAEFRLIRLNTRYRRDLIGDRTREKQRVEKLLESAAIKLSSVLTDIHGVTGRAVMDALIAGQRDPRKLAGLARARARAKLTELAEALDGAEFFTGVHARLLAAMLARIDTISADIEQVSAVIDQLLEPYETQIGQVQEMPGWGRRSAQDVIAETGVDMTRFPTGAHLASWAGRSPVDRRSAGRSVRRSRVKKGNRYLAGVLGETAVSAGRTQTREGARYRRLAKRIGKAKAQVALGNTQLKVYHALLSDPANRYVDLGADFYDKRNTTRQTRSHVRRLEALGYHVELTPQAA
jgi:transposase